jgi:hypothetical protein
MPQETKAKFQNPAAAVDAMLGAREPTLQGLVATRDDERALLDALEKAFDYRGDVTLTLVDGAVVTGYIFDRRTGPTLAQSVVRLMPADSDLKRAVSYSDIAKLEFSGRDTAAGKSFETWLKKYVEKKLAGERASIESEALD